MVYKRCKCYFYQLYSLSLSCILVDLMHISWGIIYALNGFLYLIILSFWVDRDSALLEFWAVGLWVSLLCQRAYEGAAYTVMDIKMSKRIEDLVVTPLHDSHFLLSLWIHGSFMTSLYSMSYLIFILFLGIDLFSVNLILAYVVVLPLICVFVTIGFLSGIWAKKWENLALIEMTIIHPVILLSGVFYTKESLAPHLQFLLEYNILNHYIEMLRGLLYQQGSLSANLMIGMFLLLMSFYFIAFSLWRHGWRIKER